MSFRRAGEENEVESFHDYSSDVSSECEAERAVRKRRDSSTTISHEDQHGLVGDENGVCKQTMLPVFEYLEHNPPYGREPLADKVSTLWVSEFLQSDASFLIINYCRLHY